MRNTIALVTIGIAFPALLHSFEVGKLGVRGFNDRAAVTKNMGVGKRVADVLVTKLSESGSFEMLDRNYLDSILEEQGTKDDDAFDPRGVQSGKLANVSAVVVGTINSFNANISNEVEGKFVTKKTKEVGRVELRATARLLNVQSGAIIAAVSASSSRTKVLRESRVNNMISGVGSSTSAGDIDAALSALVDESIDELATSLAKQITERAGALPTPAASRSVRR